MPNSTDRMLAYRVSPRAAIIVVIAMLLAAGSAEIAFVPQNVVIPILYPAAVAACLWSRNVRFLWTATSVAILLAVFVQHIALRPPLVDMQQVMFINRLATAITILVVAMFVHHGIRTHSFAIGQLLTLEDQNGALANLNEELGRREEEIIRQNEELQSQTEELERQTEELRVTNEELASWEKRLEQLLELARNLTAETSRGDVFSKICETLGSVAETHATALLERKTDEMQIHCHYGFGTEGIKSAVIPYADSFSSQVMQLGQTGYVADIRLRPDLQIPQPIKGPEFRAVLATPLRVDGRTIGTIEAYSAAPRAWTAAEVAVIESLALQAGGSIQGAELVETIRRERRRFEAAFRTVPFGMVTAEDAQGKKVRINGAAAALFELPSDENISATVPVGARLGLRFFKGDKAARPDQLPIARALRGEELHADEFEFRSHRGKRFTLLTSAAPILDDKGVVTGAVAAFVDITNLKELQHELELRRREAEEASVRKTRFLAAVSHDIRTPANAVNLMAEIIRRLAGDVSRSAEISEMAGKLQANIHVLMELVGDMLDVARFDTGKMELVTSEFSLADLVDQEVNQVLPLARDKGLELIAEPPTHTIWLRSDRIKVGRVLGNLLGNAIKFTERGTVRVSCKISPENGRRRLFICVEDTGIGISRENIAWIFDEFAQLQNPARDRSKGSGLGLAICRRIVELLEGSISVESDLGKGSRFLVELPESAVVLRTDIAFGAVAEGSSISHVPLHLELNILLVEDHTATRDSTARLLREEGAQVTEAPDGKTALQLLHKESFDIVLLDMMLPDLDGREILRTLQDSRPVSIRGILVLTGDLTEARVTEIRSLGADGLIGKPIDLPKLLNTLRSFLSVR